MAKPKFPETVASAGEIVRQFSRFSDLALKRPVFVTKNGRRRNVLLSVEEYERLKRRDRQVFFAHETPEEFIPTIEAIARGEIPE
ncbi:MAG: type II toxin-antitoxin system prevent-host-death family antitoxin [Rhizomicrobium sp.]|jgi:PHD/YefM family antitoxin component YafN of YafNO toxin-antitoxin module